MKVIPQHKIVALERTPEGSWCSSSRRVLGSREKQRLPQVQEKCRTCCVDGAERHQRPQERAAGAEDAPCAVTKKAQVKNTRTQKNSMTAVLTGCLARGDGAQNWLP